MPAPGERKTVQTRILRYAQEIGWPFVPRGEAERRRGFDPDGITPEARAWNSSLFFGNLLYQLMTAQILVHDLDLYDLGLMNREQSSNTFSAVE
ncbi:MAG: hypothetical protein V1854_07600 [Methanobacteriota archaeon]